MNRIGWSGGSGREFELNRSCLPIAFLVQSGLMEITGMAFCFFCILVTDNHRLLSLRQPLLPKFFGRLLAFYKNAPNPMEVLIFN